jgi:hypothetical protein
MTSKRLPSLARDYSSGSTIDRLALGRAQHFQTRESRPKSVSDDEVDAISDWSDSDRECCPLSDFESTSDIDRTGNHKNYYDIPFDEYKLSRSNTPILSTDVLHVNELPLPIIDDSTTSTRISFTSETEKPKQRYVKNTSVNSVQTRKQLQPPLLPRRRTQTNQVSPRRSTTNSQLSYSSRNHKTVTPSPSRLYLRRETTSTSMSSSIHIPRDSRLSPNSSLYSHEKSLYDDNHNQRQILSPNFSQTSSVPRVYEIKKLFVDDYDYGRLTDASRTKTGTTRGPQKWGTIVHPPFPLGYQHVTSEQVTQAVERLASPVRCRDRHTPIQSSSKRYLSVEETDALVKKKLVSRIYYSCSLFRSID